MNGGVYLLRVNLESTGVLYSGYSRNLLGFYTPDILGVYAVFYTPDILGIYNTRFLHSGCPRSLRGFYTPYILGDYEDSTLRSLLRF